VIGPRTRIKKTPVRASFLTIPHPKSPNQPQKEKQPMATALKTEALLREFLFNGVRIPDPAPDMTVEEVRNFLAPTYPEIATATLTGPDATGSALRYTFDRAIGSKG